MNFFHLSTRRMRKAAVVLVCALVFAALTGCAESFAASASPAVSITYDPNLLVYKVEFDLTAVSHKEMGRQYAQAIVNTLPQFEAVTDAVLKQTLEEANLTFAQALERANAMKKSIPRDYLDEIEGMGLVFSDPSDELGNGRLSPNKVFLSMIDVTETSACSAAAVFGKSSATGKTIVGRNNDWAPDENTDNWNALFVFHNGEKSIAGNGTIGELFPTNLFNRRHVFGGVLDSYPSYPPITVKKVRSPTVDLRHAIETGRSLADVENFYRAHRYPIGSVIILADSKTAHVLEYDTSRKPGRQGRVRTASSELIQGVSWGIPQAIAGVNSFLLPGSFDNHNNDAHNKLRFDNFQSLMSSSLAQGKLGVDQMQEIMGYTSSDGCSTTSGAIFRLGIDTGNVKDNATFQSLIVRLDTFETWIAYSSHGAGWPYTPVYYKVLDGNPFRK